MVNKSRKHLVVGLDGSPQAAHALDKAIELARALGASITAVYAIPPPGPYEYGQAGYAPPIVPPELDPEWRAAMTSAFVQDWCRPLRESGIPYETLVADGPPDAVIAKAADDVDADYVVVGRRGRGAVAELVLGSVSHALSLHCRRPVLLVSGTGATQRAERATAEAGHVSGR